LPTIVLKIIKLLSRTYGTFGIWGGFWSKGKIDKVLPSIERIRYRLTLNTKDKIQACPQYKG